MRTFNDLSDEEQQRAVDYHLVEGGIRNMGVKADFRIEGHGNVAFIIPLTNEARAWVEEYIGRDNGYQPYWPNRVLVEPRYLLDIEQGMTGDGLIMEEVA